jgi:hypothetical protein
LKNKISRIFGLDVESVDLFVDDSILGEDNITLESFCFEGVCSFYLFRMFYQ